MIVNVRPSYSKMYSYTNQQPSFNSSILNTPKGYYGIGSITIKDAKYDNVTISPSFTDVKLSIYTPPYDKLNGFDSALIKGYKTRQLPLSPSISPQSYTSTADNIINSISLSGAKLQRGYTMSPSQSSQSATLDSDCYAFETITVKGAKLEERPVATITANDQVIKPSSGYYGLKLVTVPAGSTWKSIYKTMTLNHINARIPNTANITNISVISIGCTGSHQAYRGVVDFLCGYSVSNIVNLITGFSSGMVQELQYNFSNIIRVTSSYIYVDVDSLGYEFDDETAYEVFIAGA